MKFKYILFLILIAAAAFAGGTTEATNDTFSIAVFIPGQVQGSPTYEELVAGIESAASEYDTSARNIEIKVLEAGYNQAEWGDKLRSLAATGIYDLIVSSNPSIPDLVKNINNDFPAQKYMVMDAEHADTDNVAAVMLNQYEQAYLSGYFAGLVTTSELPGANSDTTAGLLVGQEYPVMNDHIRPGFADGLLAAAGENSTIEYRVLGNWYDAEKARELAESMIRQGADVILSIAGSGNQGVVSAAEANGSYVLWYDAPGYSYGPGTVIGSSVLNIASLTKSAVLDAIAGDIAYGNTEYVGILENAVDYARTEPEYLSYVPAAIQESMNTLIEAVKNGDIILKPGL